MQADPSSHPPRRVPAPHSRGLSLIEILIVLAIIALITSGIAVMAIKAWERARVRAAANDIAELSAAVEMYRLERGGCPEHAQELVAAGMIKKLREDPWGAPYVLTCPGEHDEWDIVSSGKDTELGTEDDVESWDLER